MKQWIKYLGLIALIGITTMAASGQQRLPEPTIERATHVDEQGLQQWEEFRAANCPACRSLKTTACQHCKDLEFNTRCLECDMKKKSPCRACGGKGQIPDPFVLVHCPGCYGAGIFPCDGCRGEGSYPVQGGGKKNQKCSSCRGAGAYACEVCKGRRLIPVIKPKPSLQGAKPKTLRTVLASAEKILQALHGFTATGTNSRKETKAYQKLMVPAVRSIPTLKLCSKMLENLMKTLAKGDGWQGNDEKKAHAFNRFLTYNKIYLMHQKKLLELSLGRAEFNTEVLAKKK